MNPASRGVLLSCGIDRRDPDRMDDWFHILAARAELPPDVARELLERGFVVLPGPVASDRVAQWASACWRSDPRGAKRLAPLSGIARARSGTFQNASRASGTSSGASKIPPGPSKTLPELPKRLSEHPKRFRNLRKDFWRVRNRFRSIRNDFWSAQNASGSSGKTFGASGTIFGAPETLPEPPEGLLEHPEAFRRLPKTFRVEPEGSRVDPEAGTARGMRLTSASPHPPARCHALRQGGHLFPGPTDGRPGGCPQGSFSLGAPASRRLLLPPPGRRGRQRSQGPSPRPP